MITDFQKRQAVEIVNETLDKLGMPQLKGKIAIQWNTTFTRRLGDAHYDPQMNYCRVRFSVPLWNLAGEAQQRETVIHEVCHIVDFWKMKNVPGYHSTGGHGTKWQLMMVACGVNPNKYHNVQRPPEMKRQTKKYMARCKCREFEITSHRVTKMRNGARYMCRNCCEHISLI